MNRRNLLVHYHIYKNSGTSFEQVLDDNYGDRHLKIDGPFAFSHITQDQLANIIEQHLSLSVLISSDPFTGALFRGISGNSCGVRPKPHAPHSIGVPI